MHERERISPYPNQATGVLFLTGGGQMQWEGLEGMLMEWEREGLREWWTMLGRLCIGGGRICTPPKTKLPGLDSGLEIANSTRDGSGES